MPSGREVPLAAPEPCLIVAGHDQHVGRNAVSGQVAMVVEVFGREERGDVGRPQPARLDDFEAGRRALAEDAVQAMRLEADDRADGHPCGVVVDRAQLPLAPVDEHQSWPARRSVDGQCAGLVTESGDPRRQVIHVPRQVDQGGADRRQIGRRGSGRTGDPLEQRSHRRVGPTE